MTVATARQPTAVPYVAPMVVTAKPPANGPKTHLSCADRLAIGVATKPGKRVRERETDPEASDRVAAWLWEQVVLPSI